MECTHSVSFSWKWPISIRFCFDFIFIQDSNEFIRTCFDRLKAFQSSFYDQFETKFFENYIYDDNFQNEMKASGILSRNNPSDISLYPIVCQLMHSIFLSGCCGTEKYLKELEMHVLIKF